MLKEKLGIDEKDVMILSWCIENPSISQSEIAERLKLSQPSVNARIQKLRKKGVLNTHVGMDYNKTNLILTRVDFVCEDGNACLSRLRQCPFFVNGFILTGKPNVSVMFAHENLKKINEIIDEQLRTDTTIRDIEVNVVVSTSHDYLLRMNVIKELTRKECSNPQSCRSCPETSKATC